MGSRVVGKTRRLAETRHAERLQTLSGATLDRAGRAPHVADVVVGSVPSPALEAALRDVADGDGGELRRPPDPTLHPRFHSSRSSCGLAVNSFAPWRLDPSTLTVGAYRGFVELQFERKLPISGVGRRPPNLDLVAEGPTVLAIESKFLEYLGRGKPAEFADLYEDAVTALAHPTWRDEYRRLKTAPDRYAFLGAAQIVKHYLGMKSNYPRRPTRLLYLFWEPEDAGRLRPFGEHRADLEAFAASVDDPAVSFGWMTYSQLWDEWGRRDGPPWLEDHVARLRGRYALSLTEDG